MRYTPVYLLFLALMAGCGSAKVASSQQKNGGEKLGVTLSGANDNKICFLTMRITLTDSLQDRYEVKLLRSQFSDGTIKARESATEGYEQGFLYCELLDGEKNRLDFSKVENPLVRVYEYNEAPNEPLRKKTFTSKSGEFVLRFQANAKIQHLIIYKPDVDNKTRKQIYHGVM